MTRVPVASEVISEIEYHKKKMELDIWFTDGDHRTYRRVPEDIYQAFLKAPSAGKYFNYNIREEFLHN